MITLVAPAPPCNLARLTVRSGRVWVVFLGAPGVLDWPRLAAAIRQAQVLGRRSAVVSAAYELVEG